MARAGYAVYRLLADKSVPILRRFIETTLVHVGNFDPKLVYRILSDFRDRVPNAVKQESLPIDGLRWPHHIYSVRPSTAHERACLRELLALERDSLPSQALGKVGEEFVRACFIKSGRFTAIAQRARLGNIVESPGKNRVDLMVTDSHDGKRYAISVKNRRDVLQSRRHEWISQCIEMAKKHDATPWLLPSFATPAAEDACRSQGVRCTPIGTRVYPAEYAHSKQTKKLLKMLYPIMGGEPFVIMGADRLPNGSEPPLVQKLREV